MDVEHIPVERIRPIVDGYLARWDDVHWNRSDVDLTRVDASLLDDTERSAVRFVTYIEDHIPWYTTSAQQCFPLDQSVSKEVFLHNRELFRFFARWTLDEERHADMFRRYQLAANVAAADELDQALWDEGRKPWGFPDSTPISIFTYVVVQEKATQLFYQMLRRRVREPVLAEILTRTLKDESRHFSFYADVLGAYVSALGPRTIEPIKAGLQAFKMPLADQLKNYWRWSLWLCDELGGYSHSEAYEHLAKVVSRAADASAHSKVMDLEEYVRAIRRVA